jgi:putative phage-type endonuclease
MNSFTLAPVGELDRRTYIGGSRVSAILGLEPYGRTPLTEYLSIIADIENRPDEETLRFFEWRKEWEPIVIKRVIREFDAQIVGVNNRYIDREHEFFAAEIDAEWVDSKGQTQNLEIKTVHPLAFGEKSGWGEQGTDEVPIHYAAQCMWGLGVTGRQTCILVAMVGIDTFVFYRIDRDEETIKRMRQVCAAFWHDNVLARKAPDVMNLDDVRMLSFRIAGKAVEASDEMLDNLENLKRLRSSMAMMDEEKDELMFKITAEILREWQADPGTPPQDKAVILKGGREIASWNYQETTRIMTKELRAAHPDIAREFSKTTPSRVLRFKKEK